MFFINRVALFCAVFFFSFFSISVFASSTPDSWSQHQTGSGFRFTMDDTDVGFGNLKLGLTSRYSGFYSDTTNSQFYQYVRGYLSDVEVLGGTMRVNLNIRGAASIDGYHSNPYGSYSPNITDSQFMARDEQWDLRIYDASVILDNVVPYSTISAGRVRINHLSSWRIDGGEILAGSESINGYVFYGFPASYYQWINQTALGGGINTALMSNRLRVRGEVVYFDVSDKEFVNTLTWQVRADYNLRLPDTVDANIYALIRQIENAILYEMGVFGDTLNTNTTFNAWVKGQYDYNEDYVSPTVSEFEYVIGAQSEYIEAGVDIYQFIGAYFGAGLGISGRMNYNEWYGDRDYTRVNGNFDMFGIISGNYISITADYYYVPEWGINDEQQRLFIGGRMTQDINKDVALWFGAGMTNHQYNTNSFTSNPAVSMYDDSRVNDNVYTAYVGSRYSITDSVMVQADYMYEMSNVIKSEHDRNANSHYVQLWLNVGF
jgi:hypothetical protein